MADHDDLADFADLVPTPRQESRDEPGPELVWLQDSLEGLEAFAPAPAGDATAGAAPPPPLDPPPPGASAADAEPPALPPPDMFAVKDDRGWMLRAAWSGVLCLVLAAGADQWLDLDLERLALPASEASRVVGAPPAPVAVDPPPPAEASTAVGPLTAPAATSATAAADAAPDDGAAAERESLDAQLQAAIDAIPSRVGGASAARRTEDPAAPVTPPRVAATGRPPFGADLPAWDATASPPRPVPMARREEEPAPATTRIADAPVVLPPAAPPAAVSDAGSPASTPAPPTPSPTRAASAPVAAPGAAPHERDTRAVQTVLGQYRDAFNALDADAAQAVWPSVNGKTLARAFDRLADQTVSFDDCAIDVDAAHAEAACRGTARYVPKVGSRTAKAEARQWRFSLRRAGTGWLIDRVDAR